MNSLSDLESDIECNINVLDDSTKPIRTKALCRLKVLNQQNSDLDDIESVFEDVKPKKRRKRKNRSRHRPIRRHSIVEFEDSSCDSNTEEENSLVDEMSSLSVKSGKSSLNPFKTDFDEEITAMALPGLNKNHEILFVCAPTNIVRHKEEIPDATIFYDTTFEMGISAIYSPYKFWFYLSRESEEFTDLTRKMDGFYNACYSSYVIPPQCIRINRPAAYRTSVGWRRVFILKSLNLETLSLTPNTKVTVFLIDFGEIIEANIDYLCFLSKDFAKLPRQSYRGRLALVSPLGCIHWSPYASVELGKITYKRTLEAKVYAYETNEQIFHLVLYDKANCKYYGSIQNIFAYYKYCQIYTYEEEIGRWPFKDELYPTFDMIEKHEFLESNEEQYYYSEEYKSLKIKQCTVYPQAAVGMKNEHNEQKEQSQS
uniref:CSON010705 protein n=1 Tax=Culicoides sonorensis TaxID=179676 RepID=A0A336LQG5_CULSO